MTCEVNDTDCLLNQFNDVINESIKQTMEEADKDMINKCKKLSHENMEKFSTNAYDEIITFGL